MFRAAPLRNIAVTPPYFHSGAVWSLREAVAVMSVAQLGADLDEAEIENIVAFLESLTRRPAAGRPPHPCRRAPAARRAPDEM